MKRVLVISPHLDDAVLSAGQFIAGRKGNVDVLTVFSGVPMGEGVFTDYDKSCGFSSSKDAMVIRRQEDKEALAILNANPIHTDRLDSQYEEQYTGLDIWLKKVIKIHNYEMVIGPLGLRHPDHTIISYVLESLRLDNLYLYEDLPHRVTHPELVWKRLQALPNARLTFIGDGPIADKVRALWCYKSQMAHGDLNPYNLYVPERFHHVE